MILKMLLLPQTFLPCMYGNLEKDHRSKMETWTSHFCGLQNTEYLYLICLHVLVINCSVVYSNSRLVTGMPLSPSAEPMWYYTWVPSESSPLEILETRQFLITLFSCMNCSLYSSKNCLMTLANICDLPFIKLFC